MSRKNVFIIIGVLLVAGAVVGANFYFKKDKGLSVTTDVIRTRDLEAIVLARAVRWHAERRILLDGQRSVILS